MKASRQRTSLRAALVMTRRFMLGVKQRAETLRASAPSSSPAGPSAPTASVGAAG